MGGGGGAGVNEFVYYESKFNFFLEGGGRGAGDGGELK